ncbi:GPN-loop GTPase 2 [Blastocystis sp. ATCC 50177/Nand II]|uniref:GPN-loop GTPase 2 n=1 Tax=Blastocystis sp. subtype 1 (strain ATCC 50177 / NandII) TaxID=478820 RepID=A0A196S6U0_BLAHN|nr:GPN-loop GTPase 2 [Blastocystis sp. ATCC 50177/Nand II]OAO16052.1 GPN-loop GTPase 2 [Blastocystis sp. ATCC 50177/Nand II]
MRYGQVVLGPPGSGKSTYCCTLQNYFQLTNRKYTCDINITDLITLDDAMTTYSLGPNGGLLFCMEFLLKNMKWLFDAIDAVPDAYLLFDFPGQVELFTANDNIRKIIQEMDKRGIRLCNVNLVDSFYCSNPEVFISAGLTSLVTMINLELPSVNILSKIDLISKYGDVEYDLDYYTELPDMTRMLYGVDRKNRNLDKSVPDDEDACDEEVFVKQAKDPFQQRYRKLYWMLCDIIDDYGLLSYLPLDIQSPTSVQKIVDTIDKANGYSIFDSVNQNEMMSVYAKEDTKYADMVDEMNEKYVHHEDDFDDNDLV